MKSHRFITQMDRLDGARRVGFVRKVTPVHIVAQGPMTNLGDLCEIEISSYHRGERRTILAEVAGVEDDHVVLIPIESSAAIEPDARVIALSDRGLAGVGDCYAGRAIDALGRPIDGGPALTPEHYLPLEGEVLAPMERQDFNVQVETGVRTLDALLPIARGQRLGIFSASGVGKTSLMLQLAKQIECDYCILALVGERGREVEALWSELAQSANAKRIACVAATSDLSPALRARAVYQALCLAEYWRGQGKHVVLFVDSATRFAMAQRDIGLAAGAPPTLRAYTPNVFAALPRIVERCGGARSGGAITAIMTVLSETDDVDDPIVEVMKSLLDGHILLSRQLAEQGCFPAIDVLRSISRQSERLMTAAHARAARQALQTLSVFDEARLLIESGLYKAGANKILDEAIKRRDGLVDFMRQNPQQRSPLSQTLQLLDQALSGGQRHVS